MDLFARLMTRIRMLIGIGRVSMVDDSDVVQTIQGAFSIEEVIDRLQRAAEFGFTSNPPVGSDMLVVFVGGERSRGVVVGTNHQPSRPTGLQPGEAMLYSLLGQKVYLSEDGIVIDGAGLPVTVKNAPTVAITADTSVTVKAPLVTIDAPSIKTTGDLQVGGNIRAAGTITPSAP